MSYLSSGVILVLAGCTGRIRSIAPENLAPIPADTAVAWAAVLRPRAPLQFDLRWAFENREGKASGRAVARFAPPDTLRFDYRGPFGRSGTALIVGSAVVWAEPEGDLDNLVPVAPVLWAALGIVTGPEDGSRFLGSDLPQRRAWRQVWDTRALDYILVASPSPRFLAELREADRILGIAEVDLAGPPPTHPTKAVMRFPDQRSTFSLTVRQVDSVAAFPADTWVHP